MAGGIRLTARLRFYKGPYNPLFIAARSQRAV